MRRPGKAGRGEQWYAELSAAYCLLLANGDPNPTKALAAERHVSESTIRNQLARARELGLLTAAPAGKAGGELTDKARRLLDGER